MSISITTSQDQRLQTIPLLPLDQVYKYLGVHQCPNGSTTPQVLALLKKSTKYARAISACPLNRVETLTAYFTCYVPSITYALPACTISSSELRDIDKPVINATLSKMGFNRKFPREVVYSPRHFGGIGLRDLYCEQGIGHVKFLLSHIRTNSETGKRMIINIDQYQLLAGISTPILETTYPIPGTRNIWLTQVRTFLHETNCQLRLYQPWTFPPLRVNDVHLMDIIAPSTTWSSEEKEIFNTVRQYLNVTTLAELRTNDGKHFHHGAFGQLTNAGYPEIFSIYRSKMDWPPLKRPSPRAMRKWQQMLTREFHHLPPLGQWLFPAIGDTNFWRYSLAHLINHQTVLWVDDFDTDFHFERNPFFDRRNIYINCRRVTTYPIDYENFYDGPDPTNTPLIPNLHHTHFTGPFHYRVISNHDPTPCGSSLLQSNTIDSIQWSINQHDKPID